MKKCAGVLKNITTIIVEKDQGSKKMIKQAMYDALMLLITSKKDELIALWYFCPFTIVEILKFTTKKAQGLILLKVYTKKQCYHMQYKNNFIVQVWLQQITPLHFESY